MTIQRMVAEFMTVFGQKMRIVPHLTIPEEQMRLDILDEEVKEYHEAVEAHNVVEIADALGDIVYIAYGTALAYGIDLDAVLAEIHRSNMSKISPDGTVMRREDGKVVKGPDYFPPDIEGVLGLDGISWMWPDQMKKREK